MRSIFVARNAERASRPRRAGCGWSRPSIRLRRSVKIEMDLRLEAAALSEMAENTKDDSDFRRADRSTGTSPRKTC